jgi:Peptidase family M23
MSDTNDPYRPFPRTSRWDWRIHPVTGKWTFHAGEDFAPPEGTPIPAATPGKVVYSGFNKNFGNTVIVHTTNGYSLYAHMKDGTPKHKWGRRFGPETLSAKWAALEHSPEEVICTIQSSRTAQGSILMGLVL